jgi:L-histidine N-alpha-methyltransferase
MIHQPKIVPRSERMEHQNFWEAICRGLSRPKDKKFISSMYFYDDAGSELFLRIMELPEYYPTRCEEQILRTNAGAICEAIACESAFRLIELGAGSCKKTRHLIDELLGKKKQFVFEPIDISRGALLELSDSLQAEYAGTELEVCPLVGEYFEGLAYLNPDNKRKNTVLFLGSNIGNLNPAETKDFLDGLWYHLNDGDHVLIGFDLQKDIAIMEAAYNDSLGITREFNMNLLRRANRELGANFEIEDFIHKGLYNRALGRMESWLISKKKQVVQLPTGREFYFSEGERILTEMSVKYTFPQIEEMASASGFTVVSHFSDSRKYFVDSLLQVAKPKRL